MTQAFVRNSDDGGIIAGELIEDSIEASEIDRLAADLDEVAGTAVDQRAGCRG